MKEQKMNINPIQATGTPQYKYLLSPKCGAKTRKQTPCLAPAVRGNLRCRMHGGKGSGAPKSNHNALKHSYTTKKAKEFRRAVRAEIQQSKALTAIGYEAHLHDYSFSSACYSNENWKTYLLYFDQK